MNQENNCYGKVVFRETLLKAPPGTKRMFVFGVLDVPIGFMKGNTRYNVSGSIGEPSCWLRIHKHGTDPLPSGCDIAPLEEVIRKHLVNR